MPWRSAISVLLHVSFYLKHPPLKEGVPVWLVSISNPQWQRTLTLNLLAVRLWNYDQPDKRFTGCQQAGFSKNGQQLVTENRSTSQHPGGGTRWARDQRECMLRDRRNECKLVLWQSERWCLQGSSEADALTQRWLVVLGRVTHGAPSENSTLALV